MRKLLFMPILASLLFVSCSKNEESNDNAEIKSSAWKTDMNSLIHKNQALGLGINGEGRYSYTVILSNEFRDWELKYTYKKPNIEIKYKDDSHFGSGHIKGDTMYLDNGTFIRYR